MLLPFLVGFLVASIPLTYLAQYYWARARYARNYLLLQVKIQRGRVALAIARQYDTSVTRAELAAADEIYTLFEDLTLGLWGDD